MKKRILASVLSLVYLLSNVVLANATEINLWSERRQTKQYAALPAAFPAFPLVKTNLSAPSPNHVKLSFPLRRLAESVSLAYGSVQEIFDAGVSPHPPVLLIQDVHLNAEAQENISHTLQALQEQNKFDLIALEGAFTPINLDSFHTFPDQRAVHHVADFLLQTNKITGPIHSALTSDAPACAVVGIDDAAHYEKNVAAYKESYALTESNKIKIRNVEERLLSQQQKHFNPQLLSFHKAVIQYHKEQMPLSSFVKILANTTSIESQNTKNFLAAAAIESSLCGDQSALAHYEQSLKNRWATYCRSLQFFYAQERRWPNSTFWQRRASLT
jgi:hypothetical protein